MEFHKEIFEILKVNGGIAEIHDYILTPFFFHAYYLKGDRVSFKSILEKGYKEKGTQEFALCEKTMQQPDMYDFPMTLSVAQYAEKVILHNHWSVEQLDMKKASVIPLACFDKEEVDRKSINDLMEQIS